jgi:hypothetical protein
LTRSINMPVKSTRSNPLEIVFYYKSDCHLCDEMLMHLNNFITGLDQKYPVFVTMCDIDDNSEWFQHYREYIPVIVVRDEEICHYFFDEDELMSVISSIEE